MVKFTSPKRAFAYYKYFRINLLTGAKELYNLKNFYNYLDNIYFNQDFKLPLVFHFFYEWAYFVLGNDDLLNDDILLAIEIQYSQFAPFVFSKNEKARKVHLKNTQSPTYDEYNKAYKEGYSHLLQGNCYQFNLTANHNFSFGSYLNCQDFYLNLWKDKNVQGAYAHLTYLPYFQKMYLSNSPECLFQIKIKKEHMELFSMPIKGSLKCDSISNIGKAWKKLQKSIKDESELFMITDLLRNDLSKIENPNAEVIFKKRKIVVPGLIHQYSLIRIILSYRISLGKILNALFPGGSITGAPKKNVVKILHSLEDHPRGFYTGSTVVLHKNFIGASINIRSADIDFNKKILTIGSGGGITLLSRPEAEFDEMNEKLKSFTNLLN